MIGQKNLLNKLNTYTIDTFPRSVMLIGEKGIGKHTLVDYIKENIIKLPLLDVTQNISNDYIDAIYRNPNPMIYLIDLNLINEKEQNVLLKFIEEPLSNSFIILLSDTKNIVLNTILNRCICFELEAYKKEELATFLTVEKDQELILDILRTPGKILSTNLDNVRQIFDICDKIINKLNVAGYANTLSICDKINFSDECNKFDFDIFMDCLVYVLFNDYKETNNSKSLEMYKLTIDVRKKLLDRRVNKELMFKNFLTHLWRFAHKDKKEF